jgi:hypothetical protein
MTTVLRRRRLLSLGVGLALLAALAWAATVRGTDARLGACAGPEGKVAVSFDLEHARDIWGHIPGFKKAPELEVDSPAHVVVYEGPVIWSTGGNPMAEDNPDEETNVVCVAIGDVPIYYTSVDLTTVKP